MKTQRRRSTALLFF